MAAPTFVLAQGQRPLLHVIHLRGPSPAHWTLRPPAGARTLSRFARLRRMRDAWVLDSPLATARLQCGAEALDVIAALASGGTAASLAARAGRPHPLVRAVLGTLHAAGMLTGVRANGRTDEDDDRSLMQWEEPDLALLAHHRGGRHDGVIGATFGFAGIVPPEPAVRRPHRGATVRLDRPDLDRVAQHEDAFTTVLESRTSIRPHGRTPITRHELGEFLFRAARIRDRLARSSTQPYAITRRSSPSGGATHALELYVVADRCRGLARGIWHYDPLRHSLHRTRATAADVRWLVADARISQGRAERHAHLLIVCTARFRRLTWKYRSIALATILKDVGALFQTMYLVATAMRLAPCAIGSGDSTRFCDAVGLRFEEESPVGEFLLGARAD